MENSRVVTKEFLSQNIQSVEQWASAVALDGEFYIPPLSHISLKVSPTSLFKQDWRFSILPITLEVNWSVERGSEKAP